MKKWSLVAIWFASLVAATGLAWAVVGAAGTGLSDRPVIPVVAATAGSAPTSLPTTTPNSVGTSTPSTQPSITTTSLEPPSSAVPTTTTPRPTSTSLPASTSTTAPPETRTVSLIGGTVTFSAGAGNITFQAAIPAPGFTVSIERDTGTELHVRFESANHRSDLHVDFDDGSLDVEVDEEDLSSGGG